QQTVFPDLRVMLLHGQMKGQEKEETMAAFARGEGDILVATTVIEVGVDVPNATLMVIEDADRFGILLEGSVQAQKPFPNGSQVNVSVRRPGEIIGAAAAFSKGQKYPCDIAALEPSTVLMFRREDVLLL
ncbi:helicase-related protein, partial [Vibrio sp. FNV 38]|nr:helicase-related protein [Vibrio sp. FNV 38]